MVICFAQQLAGAACEELLEQFQNIGSPVLELLERGPAYGERAAERAIGFVHEIEQHLRGGSIAMFRDLLADAAIGKVVVVERMFFEDGVPPKAKRLVNLEVEADRRHGEHGTDFAAVRCAPADAARSQSLRYH